MPPDFRRRTMSIGASRAGRAKAGSSQRALASLIAHTAGTLAESHDGVVVVHGTDRLAVSGHRTCDLFPTPARPIVFTGAMRPYELRTTDAVQNVTEALLSVQLLPPGVYVAMHNRVLAFPGVEKDRVHGTFVRIGDVR